MLWLFVGLFGISSPVNLRVNVIVSHSPPSLHLNNVSVTPSSILTPSNLAISSILLPAFPSSKLLNRNLLHRLANGSIILVT